MANIKQQIKRNRTNEKKRQLNKGFITSTKTAVKSVRKAVEENNKEKAVAALNFANKKLDKAQAKGIYHRNYVSNKKSKLARLVNTL